MSKKGQRLREFEKNNRTFNISEAQREREEKNRHRRARLHSEEISEETGEINQFPKKKKKNKIVNVRRFITGVIILIIIASVSVSAIKIISLKHQKDELEAKHQELTEQKEDMTAEMEQIGSSSYMELQARKVLKMIKDGEILFITSEENKGTTGSEGGSSQEPSGQEAGGETSSGEAGEKTTGEGK